MTATATEQPLTRDLQAAMLATFITNLRADHRPGALATLRQDLSVEDMRLVFTHANRRPRQINDWRADVEQVGEIVVIPCDHGGVRIEHEAGYVLDVEGCWIHRDDLDLTTVHGEESTTWASRDLAVTVALALL
ncbi:hypothetical protein [Streptosporangium sp. NPDC051022]|uniref:hypothetical protein n=1 Tax=Streptosporangium sp. NPDC051022 TaxID=3155752 RepID=UPI00341ED9E1